MTQAANLSAAGTGRNEFCPCGSGKKFKRCCALTPEVHPGSYEAHLRRGNDLLRRGEFQGAMSSLSAAIQLRPQAAAPVNNLGVVFARQGDHGRAILCFNRAIALRSGYGAALNNLGNSLQALGRSDEALVSLERAVVSEPMLADAYVNLGSTLTSLGRFEEAVNACKRATELVPGDVDGWLNLGNAYKEQGLLTPASEAYRAAIAVASTDSRPYNNLAETLRDMGDIAAARRTYEQALEVAPKCAEAYSNLLYLHAFTRDISAAAELELARGWERAMLTTAEREGARVASRSFPREALERRKLRIGIVSAELGTHAVAEFLEPILTRLDRERFHLTLFPTTGRWCTRADRFRALANEHLSLVGLSDAGATELIRGQRIDVLVDTSGHTVGNRLGVFARRSAPVQCTYVGYWGTTGLTEMDYFIADPYAPTALDGHYSEKLWRLPRLGVCYPGDPSLAITWQPDADGAIRLGSFNKFCKIREETIELWATALAAVPNACLLLEDRGAHDEESHERIRSGFARHYIDLGRIRFFPYVAGHERHMLLYNQLDIALDTTPFNSGTTGFDALWMGVPLVTVESEWMGGRIAAAALRTLGRSEWIAHDKQEFAEIVGGLAQNVELRREFRGTQREQMAASLIGDADGQTRALEEAFVAMYERWLAGGR